MPLDPKSEEAAGAPDPRVSAPARPLARRAPIDLIDLASEIQRADETLASVTGGKLQVIAEQIRRLQDQAREVLERAERDAMLHHATCLFRKLPGHVYHLYRKGSGSYFSMLSPDDWRGSPPDPFVGTFRLEADMSWTPLEGIAQQDAASVAIRNLLEAAITRR
jgi:hypothetical protein